jgi:peptidoglycan LD-endopeptidase LytH
MRAKSVAWFFAGFAIGVLVLAVALRGGGRRHTSAAPSPPAVRSKTRAPLPEAAPLPDTGRQPPVQVPPAAPPPTVAPEADRQSPGNAPPADLAARHLLVPVAGVRLQDLVDTFVDVRAQSRNHEAIDIMAPRGTPVVAADEGNVVKLFTSKQGGLTVYQFDNSRTWCYYYAHLDRFEPSLKEGVLLRKGERLGYVGSSGDASPEAPHLHFAIFRLGPEKRWWEGTAINPFPFLAP